MIETATCFKISSIIQYMSHMPHFHIDSDSVCMSTGCPPSLAKHVSDYLSLALADEFGNGQHKWLQAIITVHSSCSAFISFTKSQHFYTYKQTHIYIFMGKDWVLEELPTFNKHPENPKILFCWQGECSIPPLSTVQKVTVSFCSTVRMGCRQRSETSYSLCQVMGI